MLVMLRGLRGPAPQWWLRCSHFGAFEAPRRGGDVCCRIWTPRGAVSIAALKKIGRRSWRGAEVEVEVTGAGCPGAGAKCVVVTLALRRRRLQGPARSVGLPHSPARRPTHPPTVRSPRPCVPPPARPTAHRLGWGGGWWEAGRTPCAGAAWPHPAPRPGAHHDLKGHILHQHLARGPRDPAATTPSPLPK